MGGVWIAHQSLGMILSLNLILIISYILPGSEGGWVMRITQGKRLVEAWLDGIASRVGEG